MLNEDSAEKRIPSENPFNLIWIIPAQEDYANSLFQKVRLAVCFLRQAFLYHRKLRGINLAVLHCFNTSKTCIGKQSSAGVARFLYKQWRCPQKEFLMQSRKSKKLQALTESALMISLAVILSFLKLISMPYGGAVTLASLLPIAIVSYRHGTGHGLFAATVYAVIQQILDLSLLYYATSWKSVVAIVVLDYVLAFAIAGIAGIFRRSIQNQTLALTLGCFLVSLCRYACHVISGATVWAGLSIPTEAALSFSFAYNATYTMVSGII